MTELQAIWASTNLATNVCDEIVRRYREPTRYYHNADHLLAVVREVCDSTKEAAVIWAAFFHDGIYDSRAKDNEARSADYAREVLESQGVPDALREETARLILLTRMHKVARDDFAGQVLIDADLAILGADWAVYEGYAHAIRREYAWVPGSEYRVGRKAVLERFLGRRMLYHLPKHREREQQARANLGREIGIIDSEKL
jgi:predicted metal-dependent HD superfamily phosphohydrolase